MYFFKTYIDSILSIKLLFYILYYSLGEVCFLVRCIFFKKSRITYLFICICEKIIFLNHQGKGTGSVFMLPLDELFIKKKQNFI